MAQRGEPGGAWKAELGRRGAFTMIFPAKMLRVRMIVYHRDYEALLETLRGQNLFHFTDFAENAERWSFRGVPNVEEYASLTSLYEDINKLVETLDSEQKRSFIEDMFPTHLRILVSSRT